MKSYYLRGSWNAICDLCGRQYKAGELQRNWKGQMVCSYDYEPRHPQDFVRGVKESSGLPWSRPEGPDTFLPVCTPNGRTAYPGFAVPGCVVPSYIHPLFDPSVER